MLNDSSLRKILIKAYKLTPAEERLYFTIREIYFFWGNERSCYASTETLVEETNMSSSTVKRSLKVLEEKNLIKMAYEKTKGFLSKRNIYPIEDELLLMDARSILDERTSLNEKRNEAYAVHNEVQNETCARFNMNNCAVQNEHINNQSLNNYNLNNIDIPEVQIGATAPVKTSFDVSISKPMFEKDPKERWNEIASRYHLSKVHRFDKDRIASLKARIKDCDSEDVFWNTIEAALEKSKFLQGKSSNWKPNVDFFLRRSSFVKVAEGAYTTQKASLIESDNSSPIEQAVNGYKPQSQAELIDAFLNS